MSERLSASHGQAEKWEEAGCFFLVLGSGARAGLGLKALATSAFGLKKPGEKTLGESAGSRMALV